MKKPRPEILSGRTYKIKTPQSEHALYVTINDCDGIPFEIFINSKNMEHFQWIVALTLVISAVFRKESDVTFLIDELKSIFDPKGGYFKKGGKFIPSLVAEIGEVIETHIQSLPSATYTPVETGPAPRPTGAGLCIKCHSHNVIELKGHMTCLNCADSK